LRVGFDDLEFWPNSNCDVTSIFNLDLPEIESRGKSRKFVP
jgi:hypothetical protein